MGDLDREEGRLPPLQYAEPAHHYVDLGGSCHRQLGYGLEYLNYVSYVIDLVGERASCRSLDILDFGCGDGKLLVELLQRGLASERSLGVEPNWQATTFAQAYSGRPECFVCDPIQSVCVERRSSFDLVVSVEVFEHIHEDDIPDVSRAIHEVLRPDGRLIVCVPSKVRPTQKNHYRHYDAESLGKTFPEFSLERMAYVHRICPGERWVRNLLVNRVWLLQDSGPRRWLYGQYKRRFRTAWPEDGAHLVAEFSKAG